MGVGQRLASAAAHVGGVVVVDRPDLVRRVLVPVYDRLGLDWEPTTAGALTDVRPGLTVASVASALIAELARSAVLVEDTIGVDTLALAERLAPDHEPTRV
jgi:hypothetical protein